MSIFMMLKEALFDLDRETGGGRLALCFIYGAAKPVTEYDMNIVGSAHRRSH